MYLITFHPQFIDFLKASVYISKKKLSEFDQKSIFLALPFKYIGAKNECQRIATAFFMR